MGSVGAVTVAFSVMPADCLVMPAACVEPPKKAVIWRCSGERVLCLEAARTLLLAPLFRFGALACRTALEVYGRGISRFWSRNE